MATPIAAPNNAQRPPRRTRKSNANKNPNFDNASASPGVVNFTNIATTAGYDTTSEPTPSPSSQRKGGKHANSNSHNAHTGNPNLQKPNNQQRKPSQPHRKSPPVSQATPVKSAAYAGPTFHASPAASSLPIPKMFSKSLPEPSAVLPQLISEDSEVGQTDSEEPTPTFTPEPKAREPSPLDFLFDAARQARSSSGNQSTPSLKSGNLSPSEDTARVNGHETPSNRSGTFFPLELDANNDSPRTIGPAFATPYRDRMNAYQSRQSPSEIMQGTLNDSERAAKAEALKKLLGHKSSPKPNVGSPHSNDNTRPSPQRYHSGPNTPTQLVPGLASQSRQSPVSSNPGNDFPFRDIITQRPPSSKLRQQVSPPYADPQQGGTVYDRSPSRTPRATSAKQLEDDLRRVLKLDVSS
ncbi:hypothetical protein UCRPC4_g01719 [Phaeomoniella chlamydospora]|uniref:Proteophosphoglycan 5 n=1 Tax=Phaeomoniella chlamydospora TaxID=158046 RepID=A0A0G2HA73_PHACM|nr:hypothetical protein UCRPC4_g01719 [Phaeomoniella chlamydospora]